ncbi:amino acid permease [Melanogaster broomeanus]|nr:amino acid permease [Melanogaster broomeanus]
MSSTNHHASQVPFDGVEPKGVEEANRKSSSHETRLLRGLKERHMTMISIGGVIGTGLFLGTASALMEGGPLGLLLGYALIGSICYCVMVSVGEMISLLPLPGGHIRLAERFVDPAFSLAMGWNVWYSWTVRLCHSELAAAVALINYWQPGVDNAIWITMCLAVAIGINLFGVGIYGEAEFVFASIKVITIVGLIILGIVLDLGGGPNHDRIGFRYWKDPGPFVQFAGIPGAKGRFLGFFRVLIQAAFSTIGTEAVTMAAAEAKDPRRTMPKTVRNVCIRILLFYMGGVFVIGLLVPSDEPLLNLNSSNASASPFVIAIEKAGIKGLASVINATLLTSAWSASSSDIYLSSRGMYGLALAGNAPKIFTLTSRSGLPYVSVALSCAVALLSYTVINTSSGVAFTWFADMTATAGLLSWFCVGVTYLRFWKGLQAQGIDRSTLAYASRLQPYAAWWAVGASSITLLFSGWEVFLRDSWSTSTFVTNYLPVMLFPVLFAISKILRGSSIVHPMEMDFKTGSV